MEPEKIIRTPAVGGSTLEAFIFWYASYAPQEIFRIWKNYLAANLNYFSVPLLLRTLLYPWRRDTESYDGPFDLSMYARIFVINVMSSIVGGVIRSVTIVIGLVIELAIYVLGPVCLALWFLAPVLLIAGFFFHPSFSFSMPHVPTFQLPDLRQIPLHP